MVTLAVLLSVLLTSALSATLGMLGGMVLMGVLPIFLPVAPAMMLHGAAQLSANVSRAALLRSHISRAQLARFALGSVAAVGVFATWDYVPSRPVLRIGIGLVPFLTLLLPRRHAPDFGKPTGALASGIAVTGVQLMTGIGGPVLDSFFTRTELRKERIVATKAAASALGHLWKLLVFREAASLVSPAALSGVDLGWLCVGAIPVAMLGTWLGSRLLDRLSDRSFLAMTRALTLVFGTVSLVQGLLELSGGLA